MMKRVLVFLAAIIIRSCAIDLEIPEESEEVQVETIEVESIENKKSQPKAGGNFMLHLSSPCTKKEEIF